MAYVILYDKINKQWLYEHGLTTNARNAQLFERSGVVERDDAADFEIQTPPHDHPRLFEIQITELNNKLQAERQRVRELEETECSPRRMDELLTALATVASALHRIAVAMEERRDAR